MPIKPIPQPTLGQLRQIWTLNIAKLIIYIEEIEGYKCSLSEAFIGDTARHIIKEIKHDLTEAGLSEVQIAKIISKFDPTPHREDGGHLKGIAGDLNIFKDGVWLNKGTEPIWARAGKYWLTLSKYARWDPKNDPNHFGLIHNGIF